MEESLYNWLMDAGKMYMKEEKQEDWFALVKEWLELDDIQYISDLLEYCISLYENSSIQEVASRYYEEYFDIPNMEITFDTLSIEMAYEIAKFGNYGVSFLHELISMMPKNHPYLLDLMEVERRIDNMEQLMKKGVSLKDAEKIASYVNGNMSGNSSVDYKYIKDEQGYLYGIAHQNKVMIGKMITRKSEEGMEESYLLFKINPTTRFIRTYISHQYGLGVGSYGYHYILENGKIVYRSREQLYFIGHANNIDTSFEIYTKVQELLNLLPTKTVEQVMRALHRVHDIQGIREKYGQEGKELVLKG